MVEMVPKLLIRDDDEDDAISPTATALLVVLLILIVIAMFLTAVLFFMRRRQAKKSHPILPMHNGRHLTVTTMPGGVESVMVMDEKRQLMEDSSPPQSPVPEIRLTFPEEEDESGKRQSGRMVVVKIGESGSIGLEPCHEEDLPSYESANTGRFHSLDLDRMGGLKEKDVH